jgi:dienelactone hydrolase
VKGHLAEGINAIGAVVVIREWRGLNDPFRGVAERYAGADFTALVPDRYRGQSTVEAEAARSRSRARPWCPRPTPASCGTAVRRLRARRVA